MPRQILSKKPLLEAIFELRWELRPQTGGVPLDPHYKILIGAMYEKIRNEYGFHESLPSATMPDEIAGYVVQHRFRKIQDGWPLIQIGPGIITLNDTVGYTWDDFEKRIGQLLVTLFDTYPNADTDMVVKRLLLRYIDGVEFDFDSDNVLSFLKDHMKLNIEVEKTLFDDTEVRNVPRALDLKLTFDSTKPAGRVQLRFARGKKQASDVSDALIWETNVFITGKDVPKTKDEIVGWVKTAHDLTDNWFFKTISGELLKRFQ